MTTGYTTQLSMFASEESKIPQTSAREMLKSVIRQLLRVHGAITSDDVREYLRLQGVDLKNPNSVGSAFAALSRAGEIEPQDAHPSERTEARGRLVRVWVKKPKRHV